MEKLDNFDNYVLTINPTGVFVEQKEKPELEPKWKFKLGQKVMILANTHDINYGVIHSRGKHSSCLGIYDLEHYWVNTEDGQLRYFDDFELSPLTDS